MFSDSIFVGLCVVSCSPKHHVSALKRVGRATGETRDVPRWLKHATSDHIRPMMSEFSLLMRLNDEHATNGDFYENAGTELHEKACRHLEALIATLGCASVHSRAY